MRSEPPDRPVDGRAFKDAVFGHFARVGSALGNAKRVEIVDVLAQGERSVESLAAQVSSSVANTSRHLQILAATGLVARRIDGNARIYRLAHPFVAESYRSIVRLAELQIAEIRALRDDFFARSDGVRPVTVQEFEQLATRGDTIIVDVRPELEFAAGHVDGAINIPVAELAQRLSELPPNSPIIAYCRGPYCVMAAAAVTQLRRAGYSATRLEAGVADFPHRTRSDATEA